MYLAWIRDVRSEWIFSVVVLLHISLSTTWIAKLYIFKMGDDFINSEEYLFVPGETWSFLLRITG